MLWNREIIYWSGGVEMAWLTCSPSSHTHVFQMGKTFWGVVSAAVEQSRRKVNMVAQGDGKFGPRGWPHDPSKPKRKAHTCTCCIFTSAFNAIFWSCQIRICRRVLFHTNNPTKHFVTKKLTNAFKEDIFCDSEISEIFHRVLLPIAGLDYSSHLGLKTISSYVWEKKLLFTILFGLIYFQGFFIAQRAESTAFWAFWTSTHWMNKYT